ncbi:MAG: hypothetical protein ACI9R3_006030 [Verrucomicrobiales bacterium]|jgi:hypothetical protein
MSSIAPEETVKRMNAHIEQFKQMSFRAKARIEKLAELSMVIEDELRFKEFADSVSEHFGISSKFEEKLEGLIGDYEIERNRIVNKWVPS